MSNRSKVRLESNGDYWQATYYDSLGRRRRKSLGSKSDVSKRSAKVLCERLAVELTNQPLRSDVGKTPALTEWLNTFLAIKPDLSAAARRSYTLAVSKFSAFVGEQTRIDRVTPVHAGEWIAELNRKTLSPATVANYGRHLRCLFNEALRQQVIMANPFARVRTQPKAFIRNWSYVSRESFSTILQECPNPSWQAFLALQRLGALRVSEALRTTWTMFDRDKHLLTLPASITKTGHERVVPLDPELFAVLEAAAESPHRDSVYVVSPSEVDRNSGSNQHKTFTRILERANVKRWEDLFQTLRRNAVQDLRHLLKDPWAVTTIAGHSEEVERKYYLSHIRQSDIDRVTGLTCDDGLRSLIDRWPTLTDITKSAIRSLVAQQGFT